MKRFVLSLLVLPFLLAGTGAGQDLHPSKPSATKTFILSGKISDDGKSLIAHNGQSWSITNPSALAGHEGQLLKIKCQGSFDTRNVLVLAVKTVVGKTQYAANSGDSAFRR